MRRARLLVALGAALAVLGCHSEERRYHEIAATRDRASLFSAASFGPGPGSVDAAVAGAPFRTTQTDPYRANPWGISEGQRWFTWFNCVGCHANGGGGMGPPLMDAKWRYGSDPRTIFETIMQGRPNGMPAFRGRITEQQAWQLVAYVRSLSALAPLAAEPGRSDSMHSREPPSIVDETVPYPEKGAP